MELEPGAIVVVGELHGTVEVPAFVATLLDQPHPVMLGIEWPAELQPAVDAFAASTPSGERAIDRAALIATPSAFWRWRDGRSSHAMIDLLETARALHVRVACFDGRFALADDRDLGMATALLAAIDPRAITVVLCGNLHARTDAPAYMGWHLRARHPALVALNLADGGGTAWCVLADREPGIVAFPTRSLASPLGVRLFAERDPRGYDGELAIPRITASLPVG